MAKDPIAQAGRDAVKRFRKARQGTSQRMKWLENENARLTERVAFWKGECERLRSKGE